MLRRGRSRRAWAGGVDEQRAREGTEPGFFQEVEAGGVAALVRDTAPGGAWTLRAADWPRIGPVPEAPGWDDVPTCNRLRKQGYRVCQIDLADHVGEDHSTWGNISNRLAKPLDRKAWNV